MYYLMTSRNICVDHMELCIGTTKPAGNPETDEKKFIVPLPYASVIQWIKT